MTFKYAGFGGNIVTNSNKTTTILGRYIDNINKDTKSIIDSKLLKFGQNKGGLNLLDESTWNNLTQSQKELLNYNWLEKAFTRGDDIRLISNPVTNQDGVDFVSSNPIASILLIEADASGIGTLTADDGAVIVTHYNSNDWTIATIYTYNNGTQPFSGNRQWGWLMNQNGNLELYARAVDVARVSELVSLLPTSNDSSEDCQEDTYYNIGEATWSALQEHIKQWVIDNGGQAEVPPKIAIRFDKDKLKEILESNESINQIPCN